MTGGSPPSFPGPGPALELLRGLSTEVARLLRESSLTLATAESLTGGWISAAVTMVPGSSDYFMGGVCAYDNQVKSALLGVSPETLAAHGAVSPQCSREMARGVRSRVGADIAVSSTGIAGPSGGTPEKPVGLVFLTVLDSERFLTAERLLHGDRLAVAWGAAWEALALLRGFLEGLSA